MLKHMFAFLVYSCIILSMRRILHCDANNFYASVECLMDSSLQGLPVAISGNHEKRHGIILAKNELAKSFGIKTGDVIWEAKQKCPNLVLRPPRFDKYVEISNQLFEIYSRFTDRVESFGIDECWLDVSQSLKLMGNAETIAKKISDAVKNEIGITVSIGVSFNKVFAKLGSDMKKPDAITVVNEYNYKSKAWKLPVEDMLNVGRKTATKLHSMGINTIGNLANSDVEFLKSKFGIIGEAMWKNANGLNDDEVRLNYSHHIPKSIGNSTTLPHDITDKGEFSAVAMALCEMITTRMRKYSFSANGASLYLKLNDFSHLGKQVATKPIKTSKELMSYVQQIFNDIYDDNSLPIRAIGVSTFKLSKTPHHQLEMFENYDSKQKLERIDFTLDKLRSKYGYNIVRPASTLKYTELCTDLADSDFKPFKK